MNHSEELTARGFLKKLIGFSMASWLSATISFLVTPVITRLYIPEEVGHINLFTTYMTFFQTVCVLALDQAFMRFYNEKLQGITKENFLRYCLKINLKMACLSGIIILGGYQYFSREISGEKNILIPCCLIIVILCSTFLRMSSISSRMEKNIVQYTLQVVLIAVVEKVVSMLIAFWRPYHREAILSITTGYVLLSLIFVFVKSKVLQTVKYVPKETTKTILCFALPYVPVLLLSWLNSSIPLLVLKRYMDYSSVGIYTNAVTMANILTIIQTGFSAYWEPFIYEHYKNETAKGKIKKIERLVVFALIFAAVSIVIFQDIIYLLVGEKFRASKVFFPFLMLTPICNSLADMTGIGIKLSGKSYLNIITFVCGVSTNLILSYLLVPYIGVMGAGIAVGSSALMMLMIRSYIGGKFYKINEDRRFMIIGLLIMGSVCVINAAVSGIQKQIIQIFAWSMLCLEFRNEICYLTRFVWKELRRLGNKTGGS